MDEARQQELKDGPFSKLPFGGGDLVRNANKIIKVRQTIIERPFNALTLRGIHGTHSLACMIALISSHGTREESSSSGTRRTPRVL